jgi:hypothetical protein
MPKPFGVDFDFETDRALAPERDMPQAETDIPLQEASGGFHSDHALISALASPMTPRPFAEEDFFFVISTITSA